MTMKDRLIRINENLSYDKHDWTIAKYLPELYDSEGVYSTEEWTSWSDILSSRVSLEEYMRVEDAYIRTVKRIMQLSDCHYFNYIPWSGFSYKKNTRALYSVIPNSRDLFNAYIQLKEGQRLNHDDACNLIRLSLREMVDCSLVNMSRGVSFMVGYDYYLHIRCRSIDYYRLEKEVQKEGLYLNRSNIAESVNYQKIKTWLMDDTTESIITVKSFNNEGDFSCHAKTVLFLASTICYHYSLPLKVSLLATSQEEISNMEDRNLLLLKYTKNPIQIGKVSFLITNSFYEWRPCLGAQNSYLFYRI